MRIRKNGLLPTIRGEVAFDDVSLRYDGAHGCCMRFRSLGARGR